jgi:hypothetical protein
MNLFIRSSRTGRLLRARDVREIDETVDGGTEAVFADGSRIPIGPITLERVFENPILTYLPAAPGTFVLVAFLGLVVLEPGDDRYYKAAVIAWGLPLDGVPIPITIEGPNDGMTDNLPILTPDGKVTQVADREYDNLDAWLATLPPIGSGPEGRS